MAPLSPMISLSAAVCACFEENGIRIPEDIAIVGFNNDAISKIIEPQLTTIDYPGIELGEIAARNLIGHLLGVSNIKTTNTIVVHSDLIIRKSSRPKRRIKIKSMKKLVSCLMLLLVNSFLAFAENGYELWLRYRPLPSSATTNLSCCFQRIFIHADNKSPMPLKMNCRLRFRLFLAYNLFLFRCKADRRHRPLYY